jgi:hypothetical protein
MKRKGALQKAKKKELPGSMQHEARCPHLRDLCPGCRLETQSQVHHSETWCQADPQDLFSQESSCWLSHYNSVSQVAVNLPTPYPPTGSKEVARFYLLGSWAWKWTWDFILEFSVEILQPTLGRNQRFQIQAKAHKWCLQTCPFIGQKLTIRTD